MTVLTVVELRDYTVISRGSEFGRTNILIECPYCKAFVRAYVWSLAAVGKKCTCGALFMNNGSAKMTTKSKEIK